MIDYETFLENSRVIDERIRKACIGSGRELGSVKLLPVTKTHPCDAVEYALRKGHKSVGENRVQEAIVKQEHFGEVPLDWELIGHLQSNKAKLAVRHFSRIQSVDNTKLLRKIAQAAAEEEKQIRILLQVNAGEDPAKFGATVEDTPSLLELALSLDHIEVEGLMTIAPLSENLAVATRTFEVLRNLRDDLVQRFGHPLSELSMGMTGDLEEAIKAGSTQIRVGTALFGSRY